MGIDLREKWKVFEVGTTDFRLPLLIYLLKQKLHILILTFYKTKITTHINYKRGVWFDNHKHTYTHIYTHPHHTHTTHASQNPSKFIWF